MAPTEQGTTVAGGLPAARANQNAVRPNAVRDVRAGPLSIPSLDGLRAVSFGIVFVAHAGLSTLVPGGFGVTVFFFLSGYLITTLLRVEHQATNTVSLRKFYLRRALRILPPFYLVLFSVAALSWFGAVPGRFEPKAFLAQALHLGNYWIIQNGHGGLPPGAGVLWSLAVEEHFYLLFPLLFLALNRRGFSGARQAAVFFGLCAAVLVWRCVLVFGMNAQVDRTYMGSDTRVDMLLFGCALAVWRNPALDGPLDAPGARRLQLLAGTGLLALLATFAVRSDGFRETFRYTIQGLALWPLFSLAIHRARSFPFTALNGSRIRRLGVLTYSLYLVHHLVLSGLEHHLPALHWLLRALSGLAVALGIALAVERWVERPCARLRKRLA